MSRYRLSPEAKSDIYEIRTYLKREAARAIVKELRQAMDLVADNPEAGHIREDLTHLPVKFWPLRQYLVIYSPSHRPVWILRVLHGRRNVARILKA